MKRNFKTLIAACMAGTMILLLAACGGEKGQEPVAAPEESTAAPVQDAQKPEESSKDETAGDKYKIGVCFPTSMNEFWQYDVKMMNEVAEEHSDVEILLQVADDDADTQFSQVENLITQGIDALIICPVDTAAIGPALDACHEQGIYVVSLRRIAQDCWIDAISLFDQYQKGYQSAAAAFEAAPKGNYVLLNGDISSLPDVEEFKAAWYDVLQEAIDEMCIRDRCMECVRKCYAGALETAGEEKSVTEIVEEVLKDWQFYGNSGGGVTLSGGEPLMQPEFAADILRECKRNGIHTAIETCGYARWEDYEKLLGWLDLVLFDLKQMDSKMHRKVTGVPNERILENLEKLVRAGKQVIVRLPLIPGINAHREHIEKVGRFCQELSIAQAHLLPYHKLGVQKYEALGIAYPLEELGAVSDEELEEFRRILEGYGITVTIYNHS